MGRSFLFIQKKLVRLLPSALIRRKSTRIRTDFSPLSFGQIITGQVQNGRGRPGRTSRDHHWSAVLRQCLFSAADLQTDIRKAHPLKPAQIFLNLQRYQSRTARNNFVSARCRHSATVSVSSECMPAPPAVTMTQSAAICSIFRGFHTCAEPAFRIHQQLLRGSRTEYLPALSSAAVSRRPGHLQHGQIQENSPVLFHLGLQSCFFQKVQQVPVCKCMKAWYRNFGLETTCCRISSISLLFVRLQRPFPVTRSFFPSSRFFSSRTTEWPRRPAATAKLSFQLLRRRLQSLA